MKQPATTPKNNRKEPAPARGRAQQVATIIKNWIMELALKPGDRLPQEPALIDKLKVSKGTLRESLKILETQDLIRMKTGPGGGAFISEMTTEVATSLLSTHFFFKTLTIEDIYQLRIALEPELARSLTSHITSDQIEQLRDKMSPYSEHAETMEEEQIQRQKELEFHEQMAEFCKNPLLKFVCLFLIKLLKDLTVCQSIYSMHNDELWQSGLDFQEHLLEAFENRNSGQVYETSRLHMEAAKRLMMQQEAEVKKAFL